MGMIDFECDTPRCLNRVRVETDVATPDISTHSCSNCGAEFAVDARVYRFKDGAENSLGELHEHKGEVQHSHFHDGDHDHEEEVETVPEPEEEPDVPDAEGTDEKPDGGEVPPSDG